MIIPIGADVRTRTLPAANVGLIVANVAIYLFTDVLGGSVGQALKHDFALDANRPVVFQYLTYQFLHGDALHLGGNMLFLWVFGNAVCEKMGSPSYLLFYLAGGVFAGVTFAAAESNPIIGASGAIAAVTTAFLALFPRSRITMLLVFVFITTFELPSMVLIVFKIILWDNVLAPQFDRTLATQNVAYSAHLGGYAFGFLAALLLMATRGLSRNQFDMLALWQRWRRRSAFAPDPASPHFRARPVDAAPSEPAVADETSGGPASRLRDEILARLAERELSEAARLYLEWAQLSDRPLLPRQAQLDIANQLAAMQCHREAVAAYELFLSAYPNSPDADQVRLLVGLICNRHLRRYEDAARHLRRALAGLVQESQRALAREELTLAEANLYGGGAAGG